MKKIIVVVLALSLGGCAAFNDAIGVLTASTTNPVTPTAMYEIENTLVVAASGLVTYKNLCQSKTIPQSCRQVVANIQVYTRQARALLPQLRSFVRNNDQINAIATFNLVKGLISQINALRIANGVA